MPADDQTFHCSALTQSTNTMLRVAIQDLDDCPIEFEYGKDFLLDWANHGGSKLHANDVQLVQEGMQTWAHNIFAPHNWEVFGLKGNDIHDIMFDFQDIQNMFRLKELALKHNILYIIFYMHKYLIIIHYIVQVANKRWHYFKEKHQVPIDSVVEGRRRHTKAI